MKVDDHYEYVARYVDDVIVFSKDPMSIMEKLKKTYVMKVVGKPQYYLVEMLLSLDQNGRRITSVLPFLLKPISKMHSQD